MTGRRRLALGAVAALGAAVVIGAVLVHHGPVDVTAGIALVSADGRTVTVPDNSRDCRTAATLVVAESPRTVSIFERTSVARGISCDGPQGTLTAVLHKPLGGRALIDAISGRRLSWCDQGRVLTPAHLPPGFPRTAKMPDNEVVGAPVCTRIYQSRTVGTIAITQLTGTPHLTGATMLRVRAHPAWAARGSLTWSEGGQVIRVEGWYPGGGLPFPDGELLAIAQGLR
jgi:hypothetical protein